MLSITVRLHEEAIIEDPTRSFAKTHLADADPSTSTPMESELGADACSTIIWECRTASGVGDIYGYQTSLGIVLPVPRCLSYYYLKTKYDCFIFKGMKSYVRNVASNVPTIYTRLQ